MKRKEIISSIIAIIGIIFIISIISGDISIIKNNEIGTIEAPQTESTAIDHKHDKNRNIRIEDHTKIQRIK